MNKTQINSVKDNLNYHWEPHFWASQKHHQINIDAPHAARLSLHLDYLIRQNPLSLINHVQKVMLCLQENSGGRLFIALTDLFLILNSKGGPLKERLFNLAKPQLSKLQSKRLFKAIISDGPSHGETWIPEECLCRNPTALEKTTHLYTKDNTITEHAIEDVVNGYIENAQLDEAIHELEIFLSQHPENEKLTHTLADLCIACDSEDRFNALFTSLSGKTDIPAHWQEAKIRMENRPPGEQTSRSSL